MSDTQWTRRELLRLLAVSSGALSLGARADAAAARPDIARFLAEGTRLTRACMTRFWDADSQLFRAPVLSAETVRSDTRHDRGYTLWPSLIALHCLVAGETHSPGRYAPQIAQVCDGLHQYYSTELSAYTSWIQFPGNRDAYYDDNAWAVIVLTEAYSACRRTDPVRAAQYLARAETVMAEFIVKGCDSRESPGGMRWGYDPAKPNTSDRGTSSTAGSALAALLLARAGVNAAYYTAWGSRLLDWLKRRLVDADGLVMDALAEPGWKVRSIKWTYNTGVPLRAYLEHYRLTKSADSLALASRLAHAALNREGALFDQTPHDPEKRFYWDETYFVHYLVDGLLQVVLTTPDAKLAAAAAQAVTRSARFASDFLRDPADGFYWRNWRLYAIGEPQRRRWQTWTGQTISPLYDPSERSQEPQFQSLPVGERPLVKTLLANAGAARLFWLASRLPSYPLP